jgi:Uncharacterised nucleotidyltransferase
MTLSKERDALKHLLLDMISTSRPVSTSLIAALSEDDWQVIISMAGQHRLGPILHHHSQTRGRDWPLPESIREQWAAAFRRSAMRSLLIRQGLFKLHALLDKAAIPYAALKGAWLSLHAYSHPALRPMRDIDILVASEHAQQTYQMLQNAGYVQQPDNVTPLEFSLENYKHLVGLSCPVSQRNIEVHTRLMGELPNGELDDTIADTNKLLNRRIQLNSNGEAISFLSPTDTLLHLIVHSAYDHHFNNGPLIMNDIATMLETHEINWDLFWRMADNGGYTRGCELVFAMTKIYHDQIKVPLRSDKVSLPSLDIAVSTALLTLMDFDEYHAMSFRRELLGNHGARKKIALLLRKAIPERHTLAAFAGLPLESRWVWSNYPNWLATQLKHIVFRKVENEVYADAKRAAAVENWLLQSVKPSRPS